MQHNFIKQKRIYCGKNYLEVDIYPRTKNQIDTPKGKRAKKTKVSKPAQRNLNDKNAKRYFIQLINSNFGPKDIYVTLTYKEANHPKDIKEAEQNIKKYIARLNYKKKRKGKKPLKYVSVIEYQLKNNKAIKIHHHLILDGDLTRDEVEDAWREPRQKGQKKGNKIGRANTMKLQPDEEGFAALANYLCKYEYRQRRWTASLNLKKPEEVKNDYAWTKRQIEKIAKQPLDKAFWAKKFKGYEITSEDYGYTVKYNELTGWSIYLKLRRVEMIDYDE